MLNKIAHPGVASWNALGELLEISTAAVLVGCIAAPQDFKVSKDFWLAAVFLFLSSIAARLYEGALQSREETRLQKERKSQRHVVTPNRIRTLMAVNVGQDVLDALQPLLNEPPLATDSLAKWLEKKLGKERAQEKLPDVLRYTRIV